MRITYLAHCLFHCISTKKSYPDLNKLVSSENSINLSTLETLLMSLMYRIKSSGPNTEPCGTPQTTESKSDE